MSKKERRKAKQEKEREIGQTDAKSASHINNDPSKSQALESDPLEGIPQIDESSVESLSDEVRVGLPLRYLSLVAHAGVALGQKRICYEAEASRQHSLWRQKLQ